MRAPVSVDPRLYEARIVARVDHPNAIAACAGRALADVLDETCSLEDRLSLLPTLLAVTEVVAAAHQRHVIHRNLKPSNVRVGDRFAVADWRFARDLLAEEAFDPLGSSELTFVATIIGTAAYMPPEQGRGERADERGDVYALGAILYHVLTGLPPYRGKSSAQVLELLRSTAPLPIDRFVSPALARIATTAMARDPQQRYANAGDMLIHLRRAAATANDPRPARVRRWLLRVVERAG